MSDNNPQSVGVTEVAGVNASTQEDAWTVEKVATLLDGPAAASNGNGTGAAVATQLVSGRYVGENAGGEFRLELRVDVDGKKSVGMIKKAAGMISGDLFQRSGPSDGGGVLKHWVSFFIGRPHRVSDEADKITIGGRVTYSPLVNSKAPRIAVTVPRAPMSAPMPAATVAFLNNGVEEDRFECAYDSPFFRTVEYEVDAVDGTEVFDSVDAQLPGGVTRTLMIDSPYADSGVEMLRFGESNVVPQAGAALPGGDAAKWSDSELYASMLTQFSLLDAAAQEDLGRERQWKLWVLVATEHEQSGMRGMMFNSHGGRQRQGCAVFYNFIRGDTPEQKSAALRTYVHEMGHCFNLVHSWEKSTVNPSMEDRPDSLSFMNYVDKYPGGETEYWKKFAFEFDAEEVIHLRHAFRDDIIMGGNFFGTSTAELGAHTLNRPLSDDSGLQLKLDARKTFMLCEPVVVELGLYRRPGRSKRVHLSIHPDRGSVRLAIRRPDGRVVSYRPMASRCVEAAFTTLDAEQPSVHASAYIGYGRDGFYFDQAGFYQLVAVYTSPCGSEVVSEPLTVRVRNPLNKAEEEIADLYYGHDQGALFYLLGSDSTLLESGRKSLDNVLDKYRKHPLAVHALIAKGVNEGRNFKTVTAEKRLTEKGLTEKTFTTRDPKDRVSRKLLSDIVYSSISGAGFFRRLWGSVRQGRHEAGTAGVRLDNITLNMLARRLARSQERLQDRKGAEATRDAVLDYFNWKGLKPHVLKRIDEQWERTLGKKTLGKNG